MNKVRLKIRHYIRVLYETKLKIKDKIHGKLNLEEIIEILIEVIPEEEKYIIEHINFNEELLGHVYFEDDYTQHLMNLLKDNTNTTLIRKYCSFIEYMYKYGDSAFLNIFDVSIVEKICQDVIIWKKFGKYISNELISYINDDLIPHNILMASAEKLKYNKNK